VRVFFDTNVWLASFIAHGLCADLVNTMMTAHDAGRMDVMVCPAVIAETKRRLLLGKLHADDAQWRAAETVFFHITNVADGGARMPPDFPDPDDWPIVAAAVEARADLFVTGDKALLALGTVEDLPVLDPRAAYLRLRGLA